MERFVTQAVREAGIADQTPDSVIRDKLGHLEELTGGYDFATVVAKYWEGHETGEEELKSNALRWLRAEFSTRTDARKALGVRTIIDDANVYDHLKLMSVFVRQAGYAGLVVALDELVNLYKLTSSRARRANYEQILRILNDVLQGSAAHLGFVLGGTPEFLMDTRRGLYSYEALQSRLAENTFARGCLVDLSGPVLRLSSLTPEDLFVPSHQCQTRLFGRRCRRRARRGAEGLHDTLLGTDRRRLFPDTEKYGHCVCECARSDRAKPGYSLEGSRGRHPR